MNAYNLQAAYGTAHQLLSYDQNAAAANSELAIGRKALLAAVRGLTALVRMPSGRALSRGNIDGYSSEIDRVYFQRTRLPMDRLSNRR